MAQRGNPAIHPSHAPGFLPSTVTACASETTIPLNAVACSSVSPDDSTLNLPVRPMSPPVLLARGPPSHSFGACAEPVGSDPAPRQFPATLGCEGMPVCRLRARSDNAAFTSVKARRRQGWPTLCCYRSTRLDVPTVQTLGR